MSRFGKRCPRAHRRGFTLPELMITLVLFAVIATAATRVLRTQHRFLRGAAELAELRSQLRQAVHVLPSELRSMAPAAGDVYEWSSSAVKLRSTLGVSVACRRLSDSVLVVPPRVNDLGDPRALTTWLVAPQPGDSILVHDEGDLGTFDDAWRAYEIAAVGPASADEDCDAASGLTSGVPASRPVRLRLASGSGLSRTIRSGAAIRVFRPVRYALYRSGDGRWYLGAADCNAARVPRCSSIQPISGPYGSGVSGAAPDGLTLTFEDGSGRRLTPGIDDVGEIALVRVVVRGATHGAWWGQGRGSRVLDSLALDVGVRGRLSSAGNLQ